MPQHKNTLQPDPTEGSAVTRRQVLAGTAAGVAVVASGALTATGAGAVLASSSGSEPPDADAELAPGDHLVAHVRDVRTGAIDVYVGERQVTIRDRSVAARLAAATD